MSAKRLFTGLQPSGALHIGNYLGALRPFLELYEDYESYLCVVDYHALTSLKNRDELARNITEVVKDYLAVGISPKKAVIFRQSDVPEHAELAWIFSTLVPMSMLELAHAYKDKMAKGLEANVGLFTYPVLMAADILLYDTDVVPVGEDQRQHVEYAREIANKFNNAFQNLMKPPQELIQKSIATIPGTDGRKMGKSYRNTIPLFGNDDEIRSAVLSIVTDSKGVHEPKDPEKDTVFALHRHFSEKDLSELERRYREGGIGYKESKDILSENILSLVRPMRERRDGLTDRDVIKVLKAGAKKARAYAQRKMEAVKDVVGILKY